MMSAFIFNSYLDRRIKIDKGEKHQNNVGYTILRLIKKKVLIRVVIIATGFLLKLFVTFFTHMYNVSGKEWPPSTVIIFGSLKASITVLGSSFLIMPMLQNRLRVFYFIFTLRGWNLISHLSFGIYMWFPIILLNSYF